jgi:hypothetical protein
MFGGRLSFYVSMAAVFASVVGVAACGGDVKTENLGGSGAGSRSAGGTSGGSVGVAGGTETAPQSGGGGSTDSQAALSGTDTASQFGGSGSTGSHSQASGTGVVSSSSLCSLPPKNTSEGTCTFCDNDWYCPQPRNPQPSCPPSPVQFGPCTSNCIVCGSDGSVTNWYCNTPTYSTYALTPYSCSP